MKFKSALLNDQTSDETILKEDEQGLVTDVTPVVKTFNDALTALHKIRRKSSGGEISVSSYRKEGIGVSIDIVESREGIVNKLTPSVFHSLLKNDLIEETASGSTNVFFDKKHGDHGSVVCDWKRYTISPKGKAALKKKDNIPSGWVN